MPEYRVTARNTSSSSENKIHDDDVARRYGFGGGLVPGVAVYAYVTYPLVAAFGAAWLERGTCSIKFVKPIFEGDEVVIRATTQRAPEGLSIALVAATAGNGDCAFATATLPERSPATVDAAAYAEAPLPVERPEATRDCLASLGVIGTISERYDAACAADFTAKMSDALPLYGGSEGYVHPAFFLNQANQALKSNVLLGPWIHTGSIVRHLSAARIGETLCTRGRVRGLTAKKGAEIVELDLLLLADRARPVAHVYHSAIYRLPAPANA